jgi:integrase
MLFYTGLRFGELAALKWQNVDLDRETARICETLVYGAEGRPKTKKSNRYIDLLPPVIEALKSQKQMTNGKSRHVFLDISGKELTPDHVRNVIWKPALEKAGISYRPLMLRIPGQIATPFRLKSPPCSDPNRHPIPGQIATPAKRA